MNVYIASPFFTEEQLNFVKEIENALKEEGIHYFSPRNEGGVLKDMTPEERAERAKEIYESNIMGIEESDFVLAVIDGFDPGTIFEIGFAVAAGGYLGSTDVITLTNNKYGLNVMLSQCVLAHCYSISEAIKIMKEYWDTGQIKGVTKAETIE